MKANKAWLKLPLAAMVLALGIPTAQASSLAAEPANSGNSVLGALPLHDALQANANAVEAQPAAAGLLPLPSSFYTLNNPYVLFADVLALTTAIARPIDPIAQIYFYDLNTNLPAPGPVPLPSPLLLLLGGVGMLLAQRRRGAVAAH